MSPRNGTIQGIKDIVTNLNQAKLDENTGTFGGAYISAERERERG